MQHKFQVGDRVRIIRDQHNSNFKIGDMGTVCKIFEFSVGVASDYPSGGHHCDGTCQMGYGWWAPIRCLELVEEESIEDAWIDFDALI